MQCLLAQEASHDKWYCTYTTTKALYIGTTTLQTNTNTSRYNYGRRWHHQNTFDAMPNSLRSKPQQVRMLYLYDDKSVVHRDNSLQMDTNTYVGTITENGGTIGLPSMRCLPAREASRDKWRCCTYATTEALYIGKTAYKWIQIPTSVQLRKTAAPSDCLWCDAYQLEKLAVTNEDIVPMRQQKHRA